jgi:hypothetical protein
MVYSIAILDQSDFESIGRQMPSGAGVDASLTSTSSKKRKKRGKYQKNNNKSNNNGTTEQLATVIQSLGTNESRLAALRILIEFGSASEKRQALSEVRSLAYQAASTTSSIPVSSVEVGPVGGDGAGGTAATESSGYSENSDGSLS